MHSHRISVYDTAPAAMKALQNVEACLHQCGLDQRLIELVKMRTSQINGCAYCLDMHSKELRRLGESDQRIYLLNAWQESLLYTPRERAALSWTEAVTLIAQTRAPDAAYAEVRRGQAPLRARCPSARRLGDRGWQARLRAAGSRYRSRQRAGAPLLLPPGPARMCPALQAAGGCPMTTILQILASPRPHQC